MCILSPCTSVWSAICTFMLCTGVITVGLCGTMAVLDGITVMLGFDKQKVRYYFVGFTSLILFSICVSVFVGILQGVWTVENSATCIRFLLNVYVSLCTFSLIIFEYGPLATVNVVAFWVINIFSLTHTIMNEGVWQWFGYYTVLHSFFNLVNSLVLVVCKTTGVSLAVFDAFGSEYVAMFTVLNMCVQIRVFVSNFSISVSYFLNMLMMVSVFLDQM